MNRHAFFRRAAGVPAEQPPAPSYPEPVPLTIAAGMEGYSEPLDRRRAAHLLRRTSFGARIDAVEALIGLSAEEAVDALIDEAALPIFPPPPPWANEPIPADITSAYLGQNAVRIQQLRSDWLHEMYRSGLREKLTLFWHNHFVTDVEVYTYAPIAYGYLKLLRGHAFGNFKQFVYEVGINLAMMIYLDGASNVKSAPNENYARELLELFTMSPKDQHGDANYTEPDIQEISRALTGWQVLVRQLLVFFQDALHDTDDKTFFGRTGNFGYDDVIDIIFEERTEAIAYFICSKLYKEFVYAAPDEGMVDELAALFIAEDFEIVPVMRALLKSAHFFDEQVVGARIKSPAEMMVGTLMEMHVDADPAPDSFVLWAAAGNNLGQNLLSPPTVAGWRGHHAWFTTSTVTTRWFTSFLLVFGPRESSPVDLLPLAEVLYDASDPLAAFWLPLKMVEHFSPVPVEHLDVGLVDVAFGGDLESFPIPQEILESPPYVQSLAQIFLDGVPWYEWSLQAEGANQRLRAFMSYFTRLPEFHLT